MSAVPEENEAMASALIAGGGGNGHAHGPASMTASRTTKMAFLKIEGVFFFPRRAMLGLLDDP